MPDDPRICVYIIDDDASVRRALKMLLFSAGLEAQTYESAELFLKSEFREEGACLITDFKLRGMSGLELQQQLNQKGSRLPVIFLTAFDSSADRKQAYECGAVGFFRKPVDDQALLDSIRWSLSNYSMPEK